MYQPRHHKILMFQAITNSTLAESYRPRPNRPLLAFLALKSRRIKFNRKTLSYFNHEIPLILLNHHNFRKHSSRLTIDQMFKMRFPFFFLRMSTGKPSGESSTAASQSNDKDQIQDLLIAASPTSSPSRDQIQDPAATADLRNVI